MVTRRRPRLDVYTDGACSGSPGPGGWAWVVMEAPGGSFYESGGAEGTTNQRMELTAVLKALQSPLLANSPVCIVTDSAYVMNCFQDRWHKGWKDGRKRNGDPVANWDLWEPLIRLVLERDVTWRKVKGHTGDQGNEWADRLAVEAKKAVIFDRVSLRAR